MFESALIKVAADEVEAMPREFKKMRDSKDLKAYGYKGFHVAEIITISAVHARFVWVLARIVRNKF